MTCFQCILGPNGAEQVTKWNNLWIESTLLATDSMSLANPVNTYNLDLNFLKFLISILASYQDDVLKKSCF